MRAAWWASSTWVTLTPAALATSSSVGSRSSWAERSAPTRAMRRLRCSTLTGRRTGRALPAMPRSMAWRIHQVA